VIAEPPVVDGAVKTTVASPLPAVNEEIVGAPGTPFTFTHTEDQVEPQPVALARTSTCINPQLEEKTKVPNVGAFPAKDTEVNRLLENAEFPIDVTEEGIDTEVNLLVWNALALMVLTEEGIDTEVNLLFRNIEPTMVVTELGIDTEVNELLLNAY